METLKPKILFLSTYDKEGGATAWFTNLAQTLYDAGYEVEMVVKYKYTTAPFVRQVPTPKKESRWNRVINSLFRRNTVSDIMHVSDVNYAFFPNETEMSVVCKTEDIVSRCPFVPDIIISGLVYELANTQTLKELHDLWHVPVYMTAFDANVYTGGCHVLNRCEGYKKDCSHCPGIRKLERRGEVEASYAQKVKNIQDANIGIMYASPWSLHNALQSACFKDAPKFEIGMCIDTELFSNKNRNIAKQVFDIPSNAKVLFTGSADVTDNRKGVKYFFDSLSVLWDALDEKLRDKVYILIAGRNVESLKEQVSQLPPFYYTCISFISDTRLLSLAYQAADIFVCPSIEDAGPMMVAEALSCGTPVVGFPMGLMWDQSYVQNGKTGYVVNMENSQQMGDAIKNILTLNEKEYAQMSHDCRSVAQEKLSREAYIKNFENLKI